MLRSRYIFMKKYSKIGMVIALKEEFLCFCDKLGEFIGEDRIGSFSFLKYVLPEGAEVTLVDAGVGEITAAAATQLLITVYGAEIILNCGVVGSLDKAFGLGELALIDGVVHTDRDTSAIDKVEVGRYPEFPDRIIPMDGECLEYVSGVYPDVRHAVLGSSDKFIAEKRVKENLRGEFGANVCDMEGAGIAVIAAKNGIPVFSVKVVSDNADESSATIFTTGQVKRAVGAYVDIIFSLLDEIV